MLEVAGRYACEVTIDASSLRFLSEVFRREHNLRGRGIVLAQLQHSWEMQLPSLYIIAALKRREPSTIHLFSPRVHHGNYLSWLLAKLRDLRSLFNSSPSSIKVFKSVGASRVLRISPRALSKPRAVSLYERWLRQSKSKQDIWTLEIDGVEIGDLIYDQWLRSSNSATIDPASKSFQHFLREAAAIAEYWRSFLERKNVRAVVGSTAYVQAIPIRLAAQRGIPSYEANITAHGTRYFSQSKCRPYLEVEDYPQFFQELSQEDQVEGIEWADASLSSRLSLGAKDPWVLSGKPWAADQEIDLPELGPRGVRVLVATHEFSDSPNIYRNLFPDYFEWLRHLGRITLDSPNQFILKAHPDGPDDEDKHLEAIIEEFPHFVCVGKDTSNAALIRAGADRVITMYGNIGIEFAYLGKTVVFASPHNPFSKYTVGYHCNSIEEFETRVREIGNLKPLGSNRDVCQAFFVNTRMNSFSFFYPGFQFPQDPWKWFVSKWNFSEHEEIISAYMDWIASEQYWFLAHRFGRPTAMNHPGA